MTDSTESRTSPLNGDVTTAGLPAGTLVADRFTIQKVLGRGGMGTVYLARDTLVGGEVALKLIDTEIDEARLERFRREVVAGRHTHANLVQTLDTGVWAGRLYLAMEHISGGSLATLIAREGARSTPDLLALVHDLLQGLAHLHENGIIHRDVKPGNVLMADSTAKLADFGLARVPEDDTVTGSATSVGTPAYMAPEQIRGQPLGPPADLYSAGVVLYEAATGARPFTGDSSAAVMQQQLTGEPDSRLLQGLPRRLRDLILRLLEKRPEHRFPDGAACLAAWNRGRVRRRLRLRPLRIGLGAAAVVAVVAAATPYLMLDAVRVETMDDRVRGVTRLGTTAWSHARGANWNVIEVPATDHTPVGFLVHERHPELESQRLVLLDRRGREVRSLTPATCNNQLSARGFPGTLSVYRLLPATDINGDGVPELLAIFQGAPWYLSFIAELFPDGSNHSIVPIVINPGIIERARFVDADGDGVGEWYVAALDNELLHTLSVFRVDGTGILWAPPRYGTQPASPGLRWFNVLSREGSTTHSEMVVSGGGRLELTLQNGRRVRIDEHGNFDSELGAGADPAAVAQARLSRYELLSRAHIQIVDGDLGGAASALATIDPGVLQGDPIAQSFRLLLQARLALRSGDTSKADQLAMESYEAAPISNDAPLLAVTARIIDGRLEEAAELLVPDSRITMGSPADTQELQGLIAWLEGRDADAWALFENRLRLPIGLSLQHRARMRLGQGRPGEALAILEDRSGVTSYERLDLLEAVAHGLLGDTDVAHARLARELDRHPWMQVEADVVTEWLRCQAGDGSLPRLEDALFALQGHATWDLYTRLDLPILLHLASEAASAIHEPRLASELRREADLVRKGIELDATRR